MTATELVGSLRAKGVELWVDGTRLRYRAPSGTLDPSDVERLAQHKSELIALLTANPQDFFHADPARPAPTARPLLPTIKAPTLILVGEDDIHPIIETASIASLLADPQVDLESLLQAAAARPVRSFI